MKMTTLSVMKQYGGKGDTRDRYNFLGQSGCYPGKWTKWNDQGGLGDLSRRAIAAVAQMTLGGGYENYHLRYEHPLHY
jgi:hypothetical protein